MSERAPDQGMYLLLFNLRDPVVGGYAPDRIALRRALAMSIDDDAWLRTFEQGVGSVRQHVIGPDVLGYDAAYRNPNAYAPATADDASHVRVEFKGARPDDAIVLGQEGALGQVFRNLIDNARSFSPKGGAVSVSMNVVRAKGIVRTESGFIAFQRVAGRTELELDVKAPPHGQTRVAFFGPSIDVGALRAAFLKTA